MFQARLKTTLTLLFLALVLATSFLFSASATRAVAASAPNFTISASPSSQTVPFGGTAHYDVHIQALNGFTGTVTLSVGELPRETTASFTNVAETLLVKTVVGSGDLHLLLGADRDAAFATSTITIIGTSGSLQHTTQVLYTLSKTAPDFSISVSPTAQTIHRGGTAIYSVTIRDLNGFTGTVTLGFEAGPSPDSFFFTSTSVTGNGSTHFEVQSAGQQSNLGTFTVTLGGSDSDVSHSLDITYTVVA